MSKTRHNESSLVLQVRDRMKKQALDNKKTVLTDKNNIDSVQEQYFGKLPDSNLRQLETKSRAYQLPPAYYKQDNTFIKEIIEKMYQNENDTEWFEAYFPLRETDVMREVTRTLVFDKAIAEDSPPNAPSRFIGTRYRTMYNSKEWKGIAVWLSHGFFLSAEGIQLYFDHLENASYAMLQATKLDFWFRLNSLPDPYIEYLSNREYSDMYLLNKTLLARSLETFNMFKTVVDGLEELETLTNKIEKKYGGETDGWILAPESKTVLVLRRPENKRNYLSGHINKPAGAKNRLDDLSNITQIGTKSTVVMQQEFKISEDEPWQPLEGLEIIGQYVLCDDYYLNNTSPYRFTYRNRDVTVWDHKNNTLVCLTFKDFLKYCDLYNWESDEQELRGPSDILSDARLIPSDSSFNKNLLKYDPWLMLIKPNAKKFENRYESIRFYGNMRDNARLGTRTEIFVKMAKTAHKNGLADTTLSQESSIMKTGYKIIAKIRDQYNEKSATDGDTVGQQFKVGFQAVKTVIPQDEIKDRAFKPQNSNLKDAKQDGKNFYEFADDFKGYPIFSCSEQGLRAWSNHIPTGGDTIIISDEKKALRKMFDHIDSGVNTASSSLSTSVVFEKAYTTPDKHVASEANVFFENCIFSSPWNVFVRKGGAGFGTTSFSTTNVEKVQDILGNVGATITAKGLSVQEAGPLLALFGLSLTVTSGVGTVALSALSGANFSTRIESMAKKNPTFLLRNATTITNQDKLGKGTSDTINKSQASLLKAIIEEINAADSKDEAVDLINEYTQIIKDATQAVQPSAIAIAGTTLLAVGTEGTLSLQSLQKSWSTLKSAFRGLLKFRHGFESGQSVNPSKVHIRTSMSMTKTQFIKYFKPVDNKETAYNKLEVNPSSIYNPYTPATYTEAKLMYDAFTRRNTSELDGYARFIYDTLTRLDNIQKKMKYDVDRMPIFQYVSNNKKWNANDDDALLKNRVDKLSNVSNRLDENTIDYYVNKDLRGHVRNVSNHTNNNSLTGPITLAYLLAKPTGRLATTLYNDEVNQPKTLLGARPNIVLLTEKAIRVAKNGKTGSRHIGPSLVTVGDHASSNFHYVQYKRPLGAFIENPLNIFVARAVTALGHMWGGGTEFFSPMKKREFGMDYVDWATERFGEADEAFFSIALPIETSPQTLPSPFDLAGRRLTEPASEKEKVDYGDPEEEPPAYCTFARYQGLWGFPINSLTDQYGTVISPDDQDSQVITNTVCYLMPHYTRDKNTGNATGLYSVGDGHFKHCYQNCHHYHFGKEDFNKQCFGNTTDKVYKK